MVERIKTNRVITCGSIGIAEQVVNMAICLQQHKELPKPLPLKSIIDKSAMLIGKIDMLYSNTYGDKVRRRFIGGL